MKEFQVIDLASLEFERLIVPEEDETTIDDDEDDEDDETDSYEQIMSRLRYIIHYNPMTHPAIRYSSEPFQGRVARAVSLCLYNKIHMAQLHWPESVSLARRSTSHLENYSASPSINLLENISPISEETDRIDESAEEEQLTSKLLFDGLDTLDESSLSKLQEIDV